jgi:hypothetical protein
VAGRSQYNLREIVGIVEATAECFQQLDVEARQIEAAMQFPKPPAKSGGRTAAQVYFANIMQDYFRREFGQPMTPIVVMLTQVMFDLRDGVDESTVRKRERRTGRLSRK